MAERMTNTGMALTPAQAEVAALSTSRATWVRWTCLFLVLVAAAIYPVLKENAGALAYDAGTVHLYRSYVFSSAISDGVLYPRWVQFLHDGLGSPLFTFNPPLPYYALDALFRLGLPHPVGWRILIALGLLAAASGAYMLVYLLTGRKWPALVAGIAYLYAPYVLRNALERGSLETFSMFLYPWVLWSLLWLARRPGPGRFILAVIIWAACIACHVLGPLMLAPFALFVALAAGWRYRTFAPAAALLAGILLTAFIWMPIVPEQSWVRLDLDFGNPLATPLRNPVAVGRLLAPPPVYDVMRGNNGSGDTVGLLNFALLLLGIPAAILAWVRGRRDLAVYLAIGVPAGILLFWMLTSSSDIVWRLLEPILTRLEFRTRWMGLQALAAALVAGVLLALLPVRWQRYAGLAVAALLILAALPALYIGLLHRYGTFGDTLSAQEVRTAEIASGASAFTSWNEFAPRWRTAPFGPPMVKQLGGSDFDPQMNPLAGEPAGVAVKSATVRTGAWDLRLHANEAVSVTLNLFYYPRWQARVDGQPVPVRPQPASGLVQFDLPAGEHQVALRYARTGAEWAGLAVSGLTLLALAGTGLWAWRRRRRRDVLDTARQDGSFKLPERAPSWWLIGALALLLVVKVVYVDPATTWFRCVTTADRVCGTQQTVDGRFAGGLHLRGYDLASDRLRPGGDVVVNLAWQTDQHVSQPLRSFVHVRNSQKEQTVNPETGSEIWIQEDHETPGGLLASEFEPGKTYIDEFRVPVPGNMPPGEYFLEVGWTDPATGEQVDISSDAANPPLKVLWRSILLPSVQVTAR